MAESSIRIRIHGRVQGVRYRAWAIEKATALGLDGWVRNRTDGTVEALAVGEDTALAQLVAACHEGPVFAKVTKVETEPAQGITPRDGFIRKPTV